MAEPKDTSTESGLAQAHRRYGWTALFLWMTLGLVVESLHGFKLSAYLQDPLRREFWTLAHFHGALLAMLNLVYVRWAEAPGLGTAARTHASRTLIAGSALMPLGFALGGAWHYEGDPGLGIALAPLGALLLLFPVIVQARAAWARRS